MSSYILVTLIFLPDTITVNLELDTEDSILDNLTIFKKKLTQNFKSKVFKKIIYAYLLFLVLPCIFVTVIINLKTYSMEYNNIKATNTQEANKLSQEMSQINSDLISLNISLKDWPAMRKIFTMSETLNPDWVNSEELFNIIYMLRKQKSLTDGIENIAIVYRDVNLVMDCDGYNYSYDDFFNLKYSFHSKNFNGPQDLNWNTNQTIIHPNCLTGKYSQPDETKIIMQSGIKNTSGKNKAMLLVFINPNLLQQHLDKFLPTEENSWGLATPDHQLIVAKGSLTTKLMENIFKKRSAKDGNGYQWINNHLYVYSYNTQSHDNYTSIVFHPISYVIQQFVGLTLFTLIVLGIVLTIGIIGALRSAKKSYAPIRKLMSIIKPDESNNAEPINEYLLIEESMEQLSFENTNLRSNLKKYFPLIKSNLLLSLITTPNFTSELRNELESYSISFPYPVMRTVAISLVLMNSESEEITKNTPVLQATVVSYFNDYFTKINENIVCQTAELGNGEYLLFLNSASTQNSYYAKILKNFVTYLEGQFHSLYEMEIYFGVSSPFKKQWNFRLAAKQARQALEYKYTDSRENILWYDSCSHVSINYNFTFADETRLLNYIKTGDTNNALTFTKLLISDFFSQGQIKRSDAIYIFMEILSTCVKALNESTPDQQSIVNYQSFQSLTSVNQMREFILKTVQTSCEVINETLDRSNNPLNLDIQKYLEKNFNRYELSLSYVSDQFSVSTIYVSKAIKQTTGNRFTDYLNKLRISAAKELLEKNTETIKNIATLVGFDSDKNFIRVFKRYEGITPGQYRKANTISNNL